MHSVTLFPPYYASSDTSSPSPSINSQSSWHLSPQQPTLSHPPSPQSDWLFAERGPNYSLPYSFQPPPSLESLWAQVPNSDSLDQMYLEHCESFGSASASHTPAETRKSLPPTSEEIPPRSPPRRPKRAHPCEWPGCTVRPFQKKNALEHHMRTHTGVKPFGCEWCNRHFSVACNRKRHLTTCRERQRAMAADGTGSSRSPPPYPKQPAASTAPTQLPTFIHYYQHDPSSATNSLEGDHPFESA